MRWVAAPRVKRSLETHAASAELVLLVWCRLEMILERDGNEAAVRAAKTTESLCYLHTWCDQFYFVL